MKQIYYLSAVLILGLALTACGSTITTNASNPPERIELSPPTQAPQQANSQDLIRSDSQGAIVVDVKPLNLTDPGDTLSFEIGLNTHMIDLSMDLAIMATLTTDNGRTVQAVSWEAPRGGHHVSGMLFFPSSVDGRPVLDGATKLTLTIIDLDAAERDFSWDLPR